MIKILFFIIFSFLSLYVYASGTKELNNSTGSCFLLVDLKSGKTLQQSGELCDTRFSPASTFKIALSLIGYDSGILKNANSPKWNYHSAYNSQFSAWKTAQTPTSWIRNSCIWYSQVITKKLGMKKLQQYVKKFNYGNKNLSGDVGKNNGLTHAWLSSSLKISPNEQKVFLQKMLRRELPLTPNAYDQTAQILRIKQLNNGWTLYGKGGLAVLLETNEHVAWFVGWANNNNRILVVVKNVVGKNIDTKMVKEQVIKFMMSEKNN